MDNNYLQGIGAFANILGDYAYDTNNYAQNFNFQPIQPGIGNKDSILNNNIIHEYQPIDNVSGGEVLKDTFGNTLNVGSMTGYNPYAMAATALVTIGGKIKKQFNIDKENERGRLLTNISNQQQPVVNNYAMGQNNLLNRFYHSGEGGGNLHTHGATFDNGITYFNVGGTHDQNPYGGILQGFNEEDGQPNLVEQGETKWNDYIFSNRYKAGGNLLKKYLLPEDYAGMSFADISKKLSEPLEDTPGSVIEQNTTNAMLGRLMQAQEEKRAKDEENKIMREFKKGGYIYANGGWKSKMQPIWDAILENRQQDLIPELEPIKVTDIGPDYYDNLKQVSYGPSSEYFIGPITEEQWLTTHPEQQQKNKYMNPRLFTLFDSGLSYLGDKLGITNKPDYGRSRMYRDAASNIRDVGVTTPYLQEYIPELIPRQSLLNNYRSMLASNIARINDTVNGNVVAAQALANDATNRYYNAIGEGLINATQADNAELARAAELNNNGRLSLAQLLQNNSQFNAQQGNNRYNAAKDYINDLSMQDALASAAIQDTADTFRKSMQNYLIESEDKSVIEQLLKDGVLRYNPKTGGYYLDNNFIGQYFV